MKSKPFRRLCGPAVHFPDERERQRASTFLRHVRPFFSFFLSRVLSRAIDAPLSTLPCLRFFVASARDARRWEKDGKREEKRGKDRTFNPRTWDRQISENGEGTISRSVARYSLRLMKTQRGRDESAKALLSGNGGGSRFTSLALAASAASRHAFPKHANPCFGIDRLSPAQEEQRSCEARHRALLQNRAAGFRCSFHILARRGQRRGALPYTGAVLIHLRPARPAMARWNFFVRP